MLSLDSLNLTNEQRVAFERLQAITTSSVEDQSDEHIHHELAVLESVGWDVEVWYCLLPYWLLFIYT